MYENIENKSYQTWFDFLAVFSLVNLSFLLVWRSMIFANGGDEYWTPTFTLESYVAAMLNVSLLSFSLYLSLRYIRRSRSKWLDIIGRVCFVLTLIFPLNYLRLTIGLDSITVYRINDHPLLSLVSGLVLASLGFYLFFFQIRKLSRVFAIVLVIMSPFGILTLCQLIFKAVATTIELNDSFDFVTQPGENGGKKRVVWIIFDELDLRLAFTDRPDWLSLQEFDRFRKTAVFATNAKSHSKPTKEAIPSFMTGRLVANAETLASDSLGLRFEGSDENDYVSWTSLPTVFSEAHASGANTAIVGYYHPYCRLFSKQYSFCTWYALKAFSPHSTDSIATEMYSQISGITPVFTRINGIRTYRETLNAASNVVADPKFDLVYIHASVPHGPDIFDQNTEEFTTISFSKSGYFGNLILADRFLGKIRRSMEEANLWENSVILVTADHEWRYVSLYDGTRVRKLPFMIKMAGQNSGINYPHAFTPMLITKDLVLRILEGELVAVADVIDWINHKLTANP